MESTKSAVEYKAAVPLLNVQNLMHPRFNVWLPVATVGYWCMIVAFKGAPVRPPIGMINPPTPPKRAQLTQALMENSMLRRADVVSIMGGEDVTDLAAGVV